MIAFNIHPVLLRKIPAADPESSQTFASRPNFE